MRRKHTVILVSALLGLVLLIGGALGYGVYRAKQPPRAAVPTDFAKRVDGMAVAGRGPVTVEVYSDYECVACRAFQSTAIATLTSMASQNQITLVYHPVSVLDSMTTTRYSTRAANSAVCAADMGQFLPYSQALFAAQPDAATPGLSDDELIQIAGRVGIIDPKYAQCVRSQKYRGWVALQTRMLVAHRYKTIAPTVLVDGTPVTAPGDVPTSVQLQVAVGRALAALRARSGG